MNSQSKGILLVATAVGALMSLSPAAQAAGFYIREHSAAAQGASFAGSTSAATDTSFAFFNPAALTNVKGKEATFAISGILPSSDQTLAAAPGFSDDPGNFAAVPSSSGGIRINDRLVVGFSVNAPFGLSTTYDPTSPASPDGVKSELTTFAFTPMVAVDLTENFTFGGGITIQYAEATLTSNGGVDFPHIEGDDVGFGLNLGVLYKNEHSGTQIGASFRSGINHTLEGTARSALFGPASGPGSAGLSLPSTLAAGVTQRVTDDIRLMADVQWQEWSVYENITVTSDLGPVLVNEPQNWENAWFFAVGGEYDATDDLTLRAGAAYDQTPTTDAFRTVRTPDEDRIWLSIGASYQINEMMALDAAYSYLIIDDPVLTLRNGPLAGTTASYSSDVHIFTIGGNMKF